MRRHTGRATSRALENSSRCRWTLSRYTVQHTRRALAASVQHTHTHTHSHTHTQTHTHKHTLYVRHSAAPPRAPHSLAPASRDEVMRAPLQYRTSNAIPGRQRRRPARRAAPPRSGEEMMPCVICARVSCVNTVAASNITQSAPRRWHGRRPRRRRDHCADTPRSLQRRTHNAHAHILPQHHSRHTNHSPPPRLRVRAL